MHRDVDGGDAHFDNAVDVRVGKVGERDIIAEKEGKAAVVVFEINIFAHSLGILVDETENAFVAAGMLFVHQVGGELQADIIVLGLFERYRERFAASAKGKLQFFLGDIKTVIQNVCNCVAVDVYKRIAGQYACLCGGGISFDAGYFYHRITSKQFL